jgi:hypothetical protein
MNYSKSKKYDKAMEAGGGKYLNFIATVLRRK